jgi:thymidylate kinase
VNAQCNSASRGKLYVFEGIDAAGKSSIAREFHRQLSTKAVPSKLLAFPGNSPGTLGQLVYRLHHASKECGVDTLTATSLQTLHIAAHLDAIESIILPTLEAGHNVVLDRFWWSTWAYGIVGGVPAEVLKTLIEAECRLWAHWKPQHLFYIYRSSNIHEDNSKTCQQLKKAYAQLLKSEQGKYSISLIENNLTLAEVVQRLFQLLK